MGTVPSENKKTLFASKLDLNLKQKIVKWYTLNITSYSAILDTSENRSEICVISGFRREIDANRVFLGYYVASSGNSLTKFRDNL